MHHHLPDAFASHNVRLIAAMLAAAEALGLPERMVELRMLTGMGEPIVNCPRSEALEVAHDGVEVRRGGDQVEMVRHDDVGEELEALVCPAELQGIDQWIDVAGVDEYWNPIKNGDCTEVGEVFVGAVAGHGGNVSN